MLLSREECGAGPCCAKSENESLLQPSSPSANTKYIFPIQFQFFVGNNCTDKEGTFYIFFYLFIAFTVINDKVAAKFPKKRNNYSRIQNDNLLIYDPKCLGSPCHGLRTQITVKSLAQPPESKHRPRTLSLSVGRTFVTCSMIFVDDENNEKPSFPFF